MGEAIEVKIIVYGHLKKVCGFESKTLFTPTDCGDAFRFVLSWLQENYGVEPNSVYLIFNDKGANYKTYAGQRIKSGDVFKLMPVISGG